MSGAIHLEERCELYASAVDAGHGQLLENANRRLVCVCQACAILFGGQCGHRFKRVPSRIRFLPDFQLTDAQWDGLLVPINMAFFFASSSLRQSDRDVEALPVNRLGAARGFPLNEYFRCPSMSVSSWWAWCERIGAGSRAGPKCGWN